MPTLDWIGKQAVINHHREVPTRLLHCDSALSAGDPEAGNLLVEGDNLEALKALLPYYAGQVKCIYIDPPYNTGNESWVYNDKVNSPEIRAWLGKVVGQEAEDLCRHDKWLCMMYPRIRLLRDFLTQDGVIMLSIDDNEVLNAKFILDEIFSRKNFVAQLVWEKGRKNDAKLFSTGHDYILVYANNKAFIGEQTWRAPKEGVTEIATEYHRLCVLHGSDWDAVSAGLAEFYKGLPKDHPSKKYQRAKFADARGVWRDNNISWHGGGGPRYDVIHPVTKKPCKVPDDGWRFVEGTMCQKIQDGYVVFREDHKRSPIYKSYVYMDASHSSVNQEEASGQEEVLASVFYRHSQPSNDVQKNIFGKKVFPNPKDHEVLARLIRYVTSGDRNCLIMDSFAGSGSTGHAVMQLNMEDAGNRKFILVEMDQAIARNITARRLSFVGNSAPDATTNGAADTGESRQVGYRFCHLGTSLFDEWGGITEGVTFSDLAAFVFFSDTGSPLPAKVTADVPLIGTFQGRAMYLLWDADSAGAASEAAGNVLTPELLDSLPSPPCGFENARTIYAEGCTVAPERLSALGVTFKQIPYQVIAA